MRRVQPARHPARPAVARRHQRRAGAAVPPPSRRPVKAALVVTAHGKASVALGPTADAAALKAALREVRRGPAASGGAANLRAALSLACLVARGASHPTIMAFVAGPLPGFSGSDVKEVRGRAGAAALSVTVLAPRGELDDAAAAALEALPCGGGSLRWLAPPASPDAGASSGNGEGPSPLEPRGAKELWDLKEASGAEPMAVHRAPCAPSASTAPPPRAALTPRGPLARSAFTCRDSSLDVVLHLSKSGLLRAKLPTYSTLAGKVRVAAAAAGGGASGGGAGDCYVRVLAQPRFRTLVRLEVGRWCHPGRPVGPAAGWAPGVLRVVQDLRNPGYMLVACTMAGGAPLPARQGPAPLQPPPPAAGDDAPLNLWAPPSAVAAALADLRVAAPEVAPANPVSLEGQEYWVNGGPPPFNAAFVLGKGAAVEVRELEAPDSEGRAQAGRLVVFKMPVPAAPVPGGQGGGAGEAGAPGAAAPPPQRQRRFSVWVPAPAGQQGETPVAAADAAAATAAAAPAAAPARAADQKGAVLPLLGSALRRVAAAVDGAASRLLFLSSLLLGGTLCLVARLVGAWGPGSPGKLKIGGISAPSGAPAAAVAAAAPASAPLPLPLEPPAFFALPAAAAEAALCAMVAAPPPASLAAVVAALRAAGLLPPLATVGPLDAASVALLLRHQAAAAEQQGQQAAWEALKDRVAPLPGAAGAPPGAAAAPAHFLFRGSVPQQGGAKAGDDAAGGGASGSLQTPGQQRDQAGEGELEVDAGGPDAVLVAKAGGEEVKLPLTPSAGRDPPSLGSEAAAPPPPPAD